MILQALADYYNTQEANGVLPRWGWADTKVSADLHLGADGSILRLVNIQIPEQRGKNTVLRPQVLTMPLGPVRGVNIVPYFLCDNPQFILGYDYVNRPERVRNSFEASRKLHQDVLGNVDSAVAQAILKFYETWDPSRCVSDDALQGSLELLAQGVNITFCNRIGERAVDDERIREAWQAYFEKTQGDGPEEVCLVTGRKAPVALVHPKIKGVPGAQVSGASIVSFNADAFCSYGRVQNANAPVSVQAAFSYTTALNALLGDQHHTVRLGDTTVVMWAQSGEDVYADVMAGALFQIDGPYNETDLQRVLACLARGEAVDFDEQRLDANMRFYVLGLSPNAGRLSVRYFLQNSFGAFAANVNAHQARLRIDGYNDAQDRPVTVGQLLMATVNRNSRDKKPQPVLTGGLMTAILNNTRYPSTLLTGIHLRLRAERKIGHTKAAALKAYYLKNQSPFVPKEVLTVSLNHESNYTPYVLGRLFAVYESVQQSANPGIAATIVDRYFNSAAAIPATIFPMLGQLAQKHLRKMRGDKKGLSIFYSKLITDLGSRVGERFPARLNLPEQGAFLLGYYAQTQDRYSKKSDEEESE